MNLQTIKDEIAVEIGYSNFDDYMRELISNCSEYSVERLNKITDEICIRAQKEALEKAAESTSIQYVRPKTFNYKEIEDFITNPENLIR